MLNYMVKYNDTPLDRTFAALADPTRRALLARLAEQPDLSVSALAEPFAVSLPAIMKHLDVLSDAGLVARTKTGRIVTCRLKAAPMQEAIAWLNRAYTQKDPELYLIKGDPLLKGLERDSRYKALLRKMKLPE